jgi:hypothetical protein
MNLIHDVHSDIVRVLLIVVVGWVKNLKGPISICRFDRRQVALSLNIDIIIIECYKRLNPDICCFF